MPRAASGPRSANAARDERHVEERRRERGDGELFFALSAAMPSAAVPMKKMYGNIMRVSVDVRSNCPGVAW